MSQSSILSQGLVFHAPLDEWNGTTDLVSKTVGTSTSIYPVLSKQGSGRRWISLDGVDDYVTLPTIPVFSTGDFSVVAKIKTGAIGAIRTIIGGATNSFELYISATGYLTAIKYGGSALTASTTLLAANTEYTIGYKRGTTTGTYYVNGVAAGTCTDSNDYTVACTLQGNGTGFFNGQISMLRCFNYALTPTQITNYSKPEYPIEYTHRGAGATKNILDLNAEGLARYSDGSYNTGYWTDKTNSLTATISGATVVIPPASNLAASWFNGTTSKSVLTGVPTLPIGATDRTVSIWINTQSLAAEQMPISYGTTGSHGGFYFYIKTTGTIQVEDNTAEVELTGAGSIAINTWYNIIITVTGGVARCYINNVYQNIALAISGLNTASGSAVIGAYISGASVFFNGILSNAKIHSRVLTSDERQLIYDLGH